MLDPRMERRHHEERWKRVRAEVVAERLQDDADASVDASANAIRRINKAISWRPRQWRYRTLLAIPGLAVIALLFVIFTFVVDASPVVSLIVSTLVPFVLMALTTLVVRNHAARREREDALTSRQRGAH